MLQVHPAAQPYMTPISAPPHRPGGGHPAVDAFARQDHSAGLTDADRHLWAENGRENFMAGGAHPPFSD